MYSVFKLFLLIMSFHPFIVGDTIQYVFFTEYWYIDSGIVFTHHDLNVQVSLNIYIKETIMLVNQPVFKRVLWTGQMNGGFISWWLFYILDGVNMVPFLLSLFERKNCMGNVLVFVKLINVRMLNQKIRRVN